MLQRRYLLDSLASLYGVQFVNALGPLITLPVLARALGPVSWGRYAMADALGRAVGILVEYGFHLSATRQVSRLRGDRAALAGQMSGVLGAQALLAAAATLLALLAVGLIDSLRFAAPLLWVVLPRAVFQAASPIWYFQGSERVRVISLLSTAARLASTVGIVLAVRRPGDEWKAFAVEGAAFFLATAAGLALAAREMPFRLPSPVLGWKFLRAHFGVFLFRGSASLYATANILLLGLFVSPTAVAHFAGAEKIARSAINFLNPITQTFFPRISHLLTCDGARAYRTARISALLIVACGLLFGAVLAAGAPLLVGLLLGPGFIAAVPLLRLLALLAPLTAATNVFGIQWLLPLGMEREFAAITAAVSCSSLLASCLLAPRFGAAGMAAAILGAELSAAVLIWAVLQTRRLDFFRHAPLPPRAPRGAVGLTVNHG